MLDENSELLDSVGAVSVRWNARTSQEISDIAWYYINTALLLRDIYSRPTHGELNVVDSKLV